MLHMLIIMMTVSLMMKETKKKCPRSMDACAPPIETKKKKELR